MNSIFIKFLIAFLLITLSFGKSIAQVSAQQQIPPSVAGKVNEIFEHVKQVSEMKHEVEQSRMLEDALTKEKAKIPNGETKTFEVVTKDGALSQGGTFVRIQEYKEGDRLLGPGEQVGLKFELGGGLELPGNKLTPAQKKEMEKKAEDYIREQKVLKDAEEAAKRLRDAAEAAEKARIDLAAQTKAAEEAARIAQQQKEAQLQAEKLAKEAARQEAKALRDGIRVQNQIKAERDRFREEGGPFRAPAGGGGK